MFNVRYQDDFAYSKISQNVYSTFYVEYGGTQFPDSQWTDFPVAVLKMWCENLLSTATNSLSVEFKLIFMDGPFWINCIKVKDQIKMQFINNRRGIKIEGEYAIKTDHLINIICTTSNKIVKLIKKQAFGKVNDIEDLKNITNELRQIL